jgi:uncharacterized membrane protein
MAAYFGAQFALIYMLLPAAQSAGNEQARRAALIAGFRFYNPFVLAALGVVLMTGAFRITDLKAEMMADYFARIGQPLALKLALAFAVIFVQTYITFGLAFRIARQEDIAAHGDGEPFPPERIDSMLKRIRSAAWVTIVLSAAVIFVSLTIAERATAFARARTALGASPAVAVYLDERRERAYRVDERDHGEQRAGHFAQQAVVRESEPFVVDRLHGFLRSSASVRLIRFGELPLASGQGHERSHDVEDRDQPDHCPWNLAQETVLRVVQSVAHFALRTPNHRQPFASDCRVHCHFLLEPRLGQGVVKAIAVPSELSRFSKMSECSLARISLKETLQVPESSGFSCFSQVTKRSYLLAITMD